MNALQRIVMMVRAASTVVTATLSLRCQAVAIWVFTAGAMDRLIVLAVVVRNTRLTAAFARRTMQQRCCVIFFAKGTPQQWW